MSHQILLQKLASIKRVVINDIRVRGTDRFIYKTDNDQAETFSPDDGICFSLRADGIVTNAIMHHLRNNWPGKCPISSGMFPVPGPSGLNGISAYNSALHKYKGPYGENRLAMVNWMIDELSFRGDKWELAAVLAMGNCNWISLIRPGPMFLRDLYLYAPISNLSYQAIELLDLHISDRYVRSGVHIKDRATRRTTELYKAYLNELTWQSRRLGEEMCVQLASNTR